MIAAAIAATPAISHPAMPCLACRQLGDNAHHLLSRAHETLTLTRPEGTHPRQGGDRGGTWSRARRFRIAVGTVTSAVAAGDGAALEVTWNGTHTGALATAEGTIPASGKRQETPAAYFFTFDGNRIKDSRHYFDSLTLLKQIGVQRK